jgi:predicted ArsR family transcriptional regulator
VENSLPAETGSGARLGPLPAPRRDRAQPLSQSRAALLDRLGTQPEPTTLAALTSATGLHANTVREHLDALARQGLVRRHRAAPRGRGRPAWLYEATAAPSTGPSEYAGLATALAAAIHRGSRSPRADAVAAGTEWGRELARDRASRLGTGSDDAHRRVLALLDDLGFAPQTDTETDTGADTETDTEAGAETDDKPSTVRLTRCPLLEAAHRYTDVVCGVHLGIVRGALAEYGVTSARTELLPFAEPGACLLLVDPTPEPATR